MTVLAETRPAERLTTGPGDVDHWSCCDPDVALCGFDITDYDEVSNDEMDDTCPLCAEVYDNDLPCTIPGCPIRPGVLSRLARWFR